MSFGEVLVTVVFLGGMFITFWVIAGLRFASKQNSSADQAQEARLRQLEAEVAELRDLVHTALIEQDDSRYRELGTTTGASATIGTS